MYPLWAMTMAGAAAYSPASESLTGWWRASYAGSPWAAVASAGSSGSNGTFSEATNPPATGAALNSLTPASFDGTNDELRSANTLPTFTWTAAYSYAVLVKPVATAIALTPAAPYNMPGILNDITQAYWGLVYSTSGVSAYHYDATAGVWKTATQACSSGTWHLVQVWFDGANLSIAVDSVAATTTASTEATQTGTGAIYLGRSFGGGFYGCDVAEVIIANTNLGPMARSNIKSYINARYALAL